MAHPSPWEIRSSFLILDQGWCLDFPNTWLGSRTFSACGCSVCESCICTYTDLELSRWDPAVCGKMKGPCLSPASLMDLVPEAACSKVWGGGGPTDTLWQVSILKDNSTVDQNTPNRFKSMNSKYLKKKTPLVDHPWGKLGYQLITLKIDPYRGKKSDITLTFLWQLHLRPGDQVVGERRSSLSKCSS